MNITRKIVCGIALVGITIVPVMAGGHGGNHHHDHGNDGVRLAAEIVGLVRNIFEPTPAPRHPAPPPPPPEPARHHHVHRPAPHPEFRAPAPHHDPHRR